MLKKILSIFFILCLLFSLTVPCFAVETDPLDYQLYISNSFVPSRFQKWTSYANVSISYSDSFLRATVTRDNSEYWYSGILLPNVYTIGHTYFYYFLVHSENYSIRMENYSRSVFMDLVSDVPSYRIDTCNSIPSGGNRILFYPLTSSAALGTYYEFSTALVFDITDIFDPSKDAEYYYNLISNYIDFASSHFPSTGFYQIPNFYQPFLDFHSHLFETFSFFSELGSTYSALFTFVIIITSVLLVIFLVVFMIKRFTGGKT